MAVIRVQIPKGGAGEHQISARGFPGQQCRTFTGPLTQALGGTEVSDTPNTEEVHNQVEVVEGAGG